MTDREYKAQKARVKKFVDKWAGPMGLGWVYITHIWDRSYPSQEGVAAETHMNWQYRQYTIHWYLPTFIDRSDDEIEETVVHEFCHILVAPSMYEESESGQMIKEHVATTLEKAFRWVRQAGAKDK